MAILPLTLVPSVLAFAPSFGDMRHETELFNQLNRRHLVESVIPASLGIIVAMQGRPAFGAATMPTPEELARIRKGYEQIEYLLANFEQETTVCRENGGECKRDAEPIRKGT